MKRSLRILIILSLLLANPLGFAQEDEEFFEDEEYDEPMNDMTPPPENAGDGDYTPPRRAGTDLNLPPPGPGTNAGAAANRPVRSLDAPVDFKLVDPPEYWTPKVRKYKGLKNRSVQLNKEDK